MRKRLFGPNNITRQKLQYHCLATPKIGLKARLTLKLFPVSVSCGFHDFRRLVAGPECIHSSGKRKREHRLSLIASRPSSLKQIMEPFFTSPKPSSHPDTEVAFVRWINHQHTVSRSGQNWHDLVLK